LEPTRLLFRVLVVCASLSGCAGAVPDVSPHLPAPPQATDVAQISSPYEPAQPFGQLKPGALARIAYRTTATGMAIDVRDLLVAPQNAVEFKTPGIAVYEVRDGQGLATVDGAAKEVGPGTIFSAPQGATIKLNNRSSSPLLVRVETFKEVAP
jgi:hypothetical protein